MDSSLVCPVCSSQSKNNRLHLCQISLTNAVYLCEDNNCPYPVNKKWMMVERDYMELAEKKKSENLEVWLTKFMQTGHNLVNNSQNLPSVDTDDFLSELFKDFDGASNAQSHQLDDKQNTTFDETIPDLSLEQIFNSLDAEISNATSNTSETDDFLKQFNQHTDHVDESSVLLNNISLDNHNLNDKLVHDAKFIDKMSNKSLGNFNDKNKDVQKSDVTLPCKTSGKFKNFKFHSVVLVGGVTQM